MVDGGWLENVVITGICMQRTRTPIFLRLGARTAPRAGIRSYMRGVMISDIYATEAVLTNSITGIPGMPVEDVTLSNIDIATAEPGKREWTDRAIPEKPRDYPEARMFGRLPAYGMYVRHAVGIRIAQRQLQVARDRAAACRSYATTSRLSKIAGLRVPSQGNQSPVIDLRQTRGRMDSRQPGTQGRAQLCQRHRSGFSRDSA